MIRTSTPEEDAVAARTARRHARHQPRESPKGRLGGIWTAGDSYFTADQGATLVLHYNAKDVYLVPAGHGTVTASAPGQPTRTIQVSGTPNEHAMLTSPSQHTGQLTLTLSPGLQAYDLTFG
jgi:hypothetical protein